MRAGASGKDSSDAANRGQFLRHLRLRRLSQSTQIRSTSFHSITSRREMKVTPW